MKPTHRCKAIVLLSAVLLLSVQLSGLLHASEHDFSHHTHDGVECEVLHYLNASSGALTPSAFLFPLTTSESLENSWFIAEKRSDTPLSFKHARAPPAPYITLNF